MTAPLHGTAVRSTIGKRDAQGVIRHGGEWLALWADPESVASVSERLAMREAARQRAMRVRAIAATMRAIAHGAAPMELPGGLAARPTVEDWSTARGQADSAGLRLRHHDATLHAALAPTGARARSLFDRLEAARWHALGVRRMPGILANLASAMSRRLDSLGLLHAHLASQVPLAEALPVLALGALLDRAAPLIESGALDMWQRFAATRFHAELAALRPCLDDQRAYAAAAEHAIHAMFVAMQWDTDAGAPPMAYPATFAVPEGVHATVADASDDSAGVEEPGRGEAARGAPAARSGSAPYRVFTTRFDRVVEASDLATPDELATLRRTLDSALGDVRGATARLAGRLQRQLLAQRMSAWSFDQDEGLLDCARLARIVVEPGTALSFKQERVAPGIDTVVSLLIDNSGSMRGRPIALAAMAADLAAQSLERCGVPCEVLGFTTQSWRGGRSAKAWANAGRPAAPGRVTDLLHLIYKRAATPYRQARNALGLMLRDDLLRENVDGEALLWASARLRARPERRRLLLVVSDGAPNDRATLEANRDGLYLEHHLRTVVGDLERRGDIELSAIGIRHRVDGIFRNAVVVQDAAGLGPALLSQLRRSLLAR